VRWADVTIHHTGYQDPSRRVTKLERDLRLLRLDYEVNPQEPFILFNLGWSYCELGRPADALPFLQKSLACSGPGDSIVRKLFSLLIQCYEQLGQGAEARAICREARRRLPDDPEILFHEALLLLRQGDLVAAESALRRLLQLPTGTYFASVDPALRGYKARHFLGMILQQQGRLTEAQREWEQVLNECGDHLPSLLTLAELHFEQGRWAEAAQIAARLEALPRGRMEGEVLHARLRLAAKDYTAARRLLEGTKQRYPTALWPRVIMSHALLQENQDLQAAEAALREILTMDPHHMQARHNLEILLSKKGPERKTVHD
jgi:tetratricopeptide (TPR) repeat protein